MPGQNGCGSFQAKTPLVIEPVVFPPLYPTSDVSDCGGMADIVEVIQMRSASAVGHSSPKPKALPGCIDILILDHGYNDRLCQAVSIFNGSDVHGDYRVDSWILRRAHI